MYVQEWDTISYAWRAAEVWSCCVDCLVLGVPDVVPPVALCYCSWRDEFGCLNGFRHLSTASCLFSYLHVTPHTYTMQLFTALA